MEMCVKGALVMPKNYAVMDNEEMTYVEGGLAANQLYVKSSYLNKSVCAQVAKSYVGVTGLSQTRLKKEIYAHAVMYYASVASIPAMAAVLISANPLIGTAAAATLTWIRNHSNPIDLGGDNSLRVSVYEAIWNYL